jgi:DNA-binding CsgD family transcriptional regulator
MENVPWVPLEENELRKLVKSGKTDHEIAKIMGRSASAVKNRRQHLGVKRIHGWTEDEIKQLKDLWQQGLTDRDIARSLRRTYVSTRERRLRLGLFANKTMRFSRWRTGETKVLLDKHKEGLGINEISVILNRTPGSVEGKLKQILTREKDSAANGGWTLGALKAMYEADVIAHDGQRYTSMTMKKPTHRRRIEQITLAWPDDMNCST